MEREIEKVMCVWNEGRGGRSRRWWWDELVRGEKRKGKGESSWILLSSYSFSSDSAAAAAVRNCRSLSFGSPISFFLLSFGRLERETVWVVSSQFGNFAKLNVICPVFSSPLLLTQFTVKTSGLLSLSFCHSLATFFLSLSFRLRQKVAANLTAI